MNRLFYISIIAISVLLSNCSRKHVHTCGLANLENKPSIDSRVVELKRTGIADTTIAFISGTVLGKDSSQQDVTIDTLAYSNVVLVDNKNGNMIGTSTDANGHFQFNIPPATYDLKVQFITYNTLIVRDVFFGTGEIYELKAELGQRGGYSSSSEYRMTDDKQIIKTIQ